MAHPSRTVPAQKLPEPPENPAVLMVDVRFGVDVNELVLLDRDERWE